MRACRRANKVACVGVIILIAGCGGVDKGSFTGQQICVATVATSMGRDPSIIKVSSSQENITSLSYYRSEDGKYWKYRCKLEGDKVIWASDPGRWRTGQYDSKITFSVDGDSLNILENYSDGSSTTKTYNKNQLGS